MQFEWDADKDAINVQKHGVGLALAEKVFNSPMLIRLDDRREYGEDRWVGIGLLEQRIVVVVFTERGKEMVRIISLRKATTIERKRYEQEIANRLG